MLTSLHSHTVCVASEFERMDLARHLEKAYGAKVPKNLQQKCEYVAHDGGGKLQETAHRSNIIYIIIYICIFLFSYIDFSWKIVFGYLWTSQHRTHCCNYISECLGLCNYSKIFAKEALTGEQDGEIQLLNIISFRSTLAKGEMNDWSVSFWTCCWNRIPVFRLKHLDVYIYIYI